MQYEAPIGFKLNSRIRVMLESIAYYPFHLHKNCIEIIAVLNGTIVISDSALTHTLNFGDVYIFNANDPHKIVSDDESSIVLTIHIDRDYYKQFFADIDNAFFICDSFLEKDSYSLEIAYLRFLLAKLFVLYISPSPSDLEIEKNVIELLRLLLDAFQSYKYKRGENGSHDIILQRNINVSKTRVYQIIDYITIHYKEKLTLANIAAKEYLSISYLSNYIKETSGITFSELLSLTRCEEAERLLSATNKTVDQIAVEVGFANRKHLYTQFKRWFSKTPSEYRKSIRSDLNSRARIKVRPFDYEYAKTILDIYLSGY
ncbi:MAG TPA: AraC family transcriptional regulator [Bacillota bacterium]|jgi:AraC-like DNA-binding protein|nr:AraC family transcriptional regulator [Bacillota bacterium]